MKANSEKTKQSKKATRRVLAGVLCGASVLSMVLSLVMPPISQAIANDAQAGAAEETVMGGGSSSESADVDNTTNGDAENQNSDETEGDEPGDAVAAGSSFDGTGAKSAEQPADDGANDENDVMPTAADGFTELNQSNIHNQFGNGGTPGNYRLIGDLEYANTITFDHGETVIDLNGHKITHTSDNKSLFNITGDATLTVMDSQQAKVDDPIASNSECSDITLSKNANLASVVYKTSKIPDKLIYYVTGSSVKADGISTTEALYRHEVTIGGAIVACNSSNRVSLINLNGEGCTFNLQSGVLTQEENCNVAHLICANNGSVNVSGGYVCGASVGRDGAGAGIAAINNSTLVISGGVIAGNYAPSGGGVYAQNSTVNMGGGIISGNGTNSYQRGYGAGICAVDSMVTITNGHITNNKYQFYQDTENGWGHLGFGCHGGGGIAAFSSTQGQKKGGLVISGGYITGNYSAEAGGGVYAGAWNQALSEFTFSGGIIASNVAQNSEGGGIRIAAPTVGVFNVSDTKAYITNNTTNTTNDWGGGGVFVQGSSVNNVKPAGLEINNALITNNHANGFGGGFAACPTGKTAITDTNGIAIFGNSDGKSDGNGYNRSGGTNGKNDDADKLPDGGGGEITEDFKNAGHQDLFLIRDSTNPESLPYIAAVTGQMLGGGAAKWTGTIDGKPKTISKYDGAQAKYMIGLRSDSFVDDQNVAIGLASLYITGNKSNIHGGGIMTNGDVVAGSTTEVKVYPKMKLNGTKVLEGGSLEGNDFNFQLLKQNEIKDKSGRVTGYTVPSFDANGNLHLNGCSVVDTAANAKNGSFSFNLSEVYADADLVYYLVEVPGTDKDVNYDKTIYKIDPTVTEDPTKTHDVLGIKYKYYTVSNVEITKMFDDKTETSDVTPTSEDGVACVALTGGATFTNKYTPYTSTGSWTPKATKVVKGGEMKEFTLQLATNKEFTENVQDKSTQAAGDKSQTLSFAEIEYKLDQLEKLASDSTGRGANKTFTYYVREQQPSALFTNYKYDQSVYKITVTATDQSDKTIKCDVTYTKIVNADGKDIPENEQNAVTYVPTKDEATGKEQSVPVFTNTYSTSLPLSGMSGVTLTYLVGAAVLCAAAAWMHIRRKANAKGGERRE